MVNNLAHVDAALAERVAAPLGIGPPDAQAATQWPGFRPSPVKGDVTASPRLSMAAAADGGIATRTVAILVAPGVDAAGVAQVTRALTLSGARCKLLGLTLGSVSTADGRTLPVDGTLINSPSVMFDAVYLPALGVGNTALSTQGDAVHFVLEAYKHCKTIAATGSGAALLASLGIALPDQAGVSQAQAGVLLTTVDTPPAELAAAFIQAISQHRHWGRSHLSAVPA